MSNLILPAPPEYTPTLLKKVLAFSGWNMDLSLNKTVPHGLDATKIRNVTCLVSNNSGTGRFALPYPNGGATAYEGIDVWSTTIQLNRQTGGYFDAVVFNNAYGWITIEYEA